MRRAVALCTTRSSKKTPAVLAGCSDSTVCLQIKEPIQTRSAQLLRTHSLCVHVYLSVKVSIKTDGVQQETKKPNNFCLFAKGIKGLSLF